MFEFARAGDARPAFDSLAAAESFLRGFLRDEWNCRSLRTLFREAFPGTIPARWSDGEIARRLAPLLVRDRLRVLRTREEAQPIPLGAAGSPTEKPPEAPKEVVKEKTWIEFELLDEDGEPMAGEEYELALPDGSLQKGKLDPKGLVRVAGIDPGLGTISWFVKPSKAKKKGAIESLDKKKTNPKAFTTFKVLELTFLSDHDLLLNNTKTWGSKGYSRYAKPEWTSGGVNEPITHTKGQPIKLKVKFEVGPKTAAPQMAFLRGEYANGYAEFEGVIPNLAPGEHAVTLESKGSLPSQIAKIQKSFQWKLKPGLDETLVGGTTGPHTMFLTYGTPIKDLPKPWAEDGVTVKRMQTCVDWVGSLSPSDQNDLHRVVEKLMKKLGKYTLMSSPKVPEEFDHPGYQPTVQMGDLGGAWALAEYTTEGAECQAMVRFVNGVFRQLGAPGTYKPVVVYAHPGHKGGAEAMEQDYPPTTPVSHRKLDKGLFTKTRELWSTLVDGHVDAGWAYPPPHTPLPGGKRSPGLNTFEACLFLDANGKKKYYGGGAGSYDSKQAVLVDCFWGLLYVHFLPGGGYTVETIVRKY